MVSSLKADLEVAIAAKAELEDQIGMLEKELESATEAGLELERMLREILSTNNADNPLAKSVEDLQTRLNAQQAANEALTNALNLKSQEVRIYNRIFLLLALLTLFFCCCLQVVEFLFGSSSMNSIKPRLVMAFVKSCFIRVKV